ncbi:bifunctional diguanylate cyclase/phosphodiesterase [Halobacillus salinus]|uniref:EAL domain-containing protein n=1 Tax=Halobacillus salinus TaxID=192814 RepID=A0A4Z0GVY7_9BACI|nr:GGDEF domain-containing phosphodiesterase [Halobacillus salinus]TGB01915.1 EAL domain-containing protein [Halobacillus salinus]
MAQTIDHPWKTLKQLSIPMWFFDQRDQRVYLNDALTEDLGMDNASISKSEIRDLIHKEDLSLMKLVTDPNRKQTFHLNYRLKSKNGYRWVKDVVTPFHTDDQTFLGYSGLSVSGSFCQDELNQLKRSITEIGEAFSTANGQSFFNFFVEYLAGLLGVNTVLVGELSTDDKGVVSTISMYHDGVTSSGYHYSLEGTPCEDVLVEHECFFQADVQSLYPEDDFLRQHDIQSYLGKALLNSQGDVVGIIVIMDSKPFSNGPLSRAIFQILADRIENELTKMKAESKLQKLSQYDSLTGLAKRDYFSELMKQELKAACDQDTKLGLLIIDLDNFKMINDTWGHEKGDELLREFAVHLKRTFARKRCIISRISSDEFVVLLKDVSTVDEVCSMADHVIQSMGRPFMIGQKEYYTTVSIGVSFFPHDGTDEDAMLRYANAAMQKVKRSGKNRYELYDAQMSQEMREEMMLKQALHHALDKREFVLHYQPQICGRTRRIIGYEALIRWQQPEFGLLSPHFFIRLAEESGMITQLGEWVLNEACRQLKVWQLRYKRPDLNISVNLSARQFVDETLSEKIFGALEASNLSPENLVVEITETMVLQDFDRSIETLKQLRDKGVKVHLDDFGVGFSSLSYLSRLPVDAIKIDRSFINKIDAGENDVAIVSAIIAMAQSLRLQIIAEGVEREAHIRYLSQKGCYDYQGYYFSKPQPAECVSL